MPGIGQIAVLCLACALFAGATVLSLLRIWKDHPGQRVAAKICVYVGIVLGLVVLIWHAGTRGQWVPLGDNFDSLVWLGLLLAGFVMYVQRRRPVGGIDWFVLPIAALLLIAAAVFGRTKPHAYVTSTWSIAHQATLFGCAAAFFVAGASGVMYLIANNRLRSKTAMLSGTSGIGSLERLEHLTMNSVSVGFALLTIGVVTGVVKIIDKGANTSMGAQWYLSPKVWLTAAVWIVYGLVLHSPINPSFRGKKAAILSIVGVVLLVGTIVAVQFMPKGAH